jgi:hypothetical protein
LVAVRGEGEREREREGERKKREKRNSVDTAADFNPLNAELNPMCHLLILLGNLTFMGKCIVSISNKMHCYTVYLYMETALHVSGGISTHHQERIQLYLQHMHSKISLSQTSWSIVYCMVK